MMSRADWTFLEKLLDEGQEYSTGIGRVWLTVLFLFRMLVLGTAAESAWDDEQEDFVCNTKQPGCSAVCYDKAFPISHFRYFILQIIFVSTPTIFYFGYVAIRSRRNQEKEDEKQGDVGGSKKGAIVIEWDNNNVNKDNAEEKQEACGKDKKLYKAPHEESKLKGRLLCAYTFSILLKILLEVGFIVGLWFLYDGFFIAPKFECTVWPCPHTVDCFVSRPTEKTIFTIYTQVIAAISVFLNLVELLHLFKSVVSYRTEKRFQAQQDYLPRSERVTARKHETPELQVAVEQSHKAGTHADFPIQGESTCYSNPCESNGDLAIEVNWGSSETANELLPSYVNCMGVMRTHSPRVHYKKHGHQTGKNIKGPSKGQSKQKHYV